MIKHIFFDLDDTIIQTQRIYTEVKGMVAQLVIDFTDTAASKEDVLKKFVEFDNRNVGGYGLSKERFPQSWVDTYLYYNNGEGTHEEIISESAYEIFRKKAKKYPGAEDLLKSLQGKGYEVCLLTSGDEGIQHKRIQEANIGQYFDNIYVVPEKTVDAYLRVLQERIPEECLMFGNSRKADIHPTLSIGMTAVHVERRTWDYDVYHIDKNNPKYYQFKTLYEARKGLERILDANV